MSEVRLTVGGRNYTLRCEDGQEEHIRKLANVIDAKLGTMGPNLSNMEAKNLLFAALLLADELEEKGAPFSPSDDVVHAERLEKLADALEKQADRLEAEASAS